MIPCFFRPRARLNYAEERARSQEWRLRRVECFAALPGASGPETPIVVGGMLAPCLDPGVELSLYGAPKKSPSSAPIASGFSWIAQCVPLSSSTSCASSTQSRLRRVMADGMKASSGANTTRVGG